MGYTEMHREVAGLLRHSVTDSPIPGTDIRVIREEFHSVNGYSLPLNSNMPGIFRGFFESDTMSDVNDNFHYYIFLPREASGGYILLLHGLNERSWDKYLTWAMRLAGDTRRPVILFPIAYHMNRSPLFWFDRHAMMPAVMARLDAVPGTRLTSFINVALSTRMSLTPEQFLLSGLQAVKDLNHLIQQISEGRHPHIGNEGHPDIFAYSIGAMIAQVLMLSRGTIFPENGRMMLFCGGSVLNLMNGASKMIMDSQAFDRLIRFYIDEIDIKAGDTDDWFIRILKDYSDGEAFYGMSSLKRMKDVYGSPFRRNQGRIKAVTIDCDHVIPSGAVSDTLAGSDVEIWSPGYPCTHENPFPSLAGEAAMQVDSTFDRLFNMAADFLS